MQMAARVTEITDDMLGSRMATSRAIMAMTTISSTSVNALRFMALSP
jgi:hypothetical protein